MVDSSLSHIKHSTLRRNIMFDITVHVEGKEHSGKTSLVAALADFLKSNGVDVTVALQDPQFAEKLQDPAAALERLKSARVVIREFETRV
jgi:thymidylate kinase